MGMTQIPETKAFEVIGKQQIEIVVLREHVGILQAHKCEPCKAECCVGNPPAEAKAKK